MIRLMTKFTGKYKILIPRGYKFQKLYASDYRTYRKEFGITKQWLVIWQKGNDIEIGDFFSKSGWLIKYFIENRDRLNEIVEDGCLSIIMNTKTGKMRYYNLTDYETRRGYQELERRLYSRAETDKGYTALDLYYKKWKKAHFRIEMIEEVLKLYDDGFIKFEDKEFKSI